ncbi:DUF2306 domain-containing protein [Thermomonospora umbrina]|uniref:Putative membrane protein n=1 Tax=Thermomonospora umbrina TaxID=111806 RepID=A0A3D9T3Q3_9ACTN|nr:DUF2306 domain-containing protein [Thermomonospora umbrina]REE99394.1 putative membrane protein [Thermomonospora umbrina]
MKKTAGLWWLALSAAAIAVYAPFPYLTESLDALAADDTGLASNYAGRPLWVRAALYVHIVAGGLVLLLSPVQLSSRLRGRLPRLHRVCGRVVLLAIVPGAVAGLLISPFNLAGPIGTAGFGLLALVWLAVAVAAHRAARRRDFRAHRRWALRVFALTYAGVTLRLWLIVLILAQPGTDHEVAFDRAYLIVPFLSWVPNLLLAEFLLRRGSAPRSRGRALDLDLARG